jgi:hypothetical protein
VILLPPELEHQLPPLYSTENVPAEAKIAVAKFFFPAGRGTWFAVESSRQDDDVTFFGYVISPLGPDCDEWGYFTLAELESVRVHGLRIERDLYFTPTPMADLLAELAAR